MLGMSSFKCNGFKYYSDIKSGFTICRARAIGLSSVAFLGRSYSAGTSLPVKSQKRYLNVQACTGSQFGVSSGRSLPDYTLLQGLERCLSGLVFARRAGVIQGHLD